MEKFLYEVYGHHVVGWFEIAAVTGKYVATNQEDVLKLAKNQKMFGIYRVNFLGVAKENDELGLQGKLSILHRETTDLLNKWYG